MGIEEGSEGRARLMSRRDLVGFAAVAGGAALMLNLKGVAGVASGEAPSGPRPVPFKADLPIPRVAKPVAGPNPNIDYYEIHQRLVNAEIFPGLKTPMWTYDGSFPGPTIWAKEGRAVSVRHFNDLGPQGAHTVVHTHGALVDGDNDGHAEDMVEPGSYRDYAFANASQGPRALQSARTMWYHDHAMDETGRNVNMGLAGFYLLDDDTATSQQLPRAEFDIPLAIADRLFNNDGSFNFPWPQEFTNGLEGNVLLVNGAIQPRFAVGTRKYRFRLLNASAFRQFEFAFSNKMPFQVIATEAGYLPTPITVTSLFMCQAERFEIIVDFSALPLNSSVEFLNLNGVGTLAQVMRFDVTRRLVDDSTVPKVLRTIEKIPVSDATVHRTFEFNRRGGVYAINGLPYDGNRIDAQPRAGTTEIWTIRNSSGGWTHPIHLHLTNFQVLNRTRVRLRSYEAASWKETVYLPENCEAQIIMTWPDVPADPLGRAPRKYKNTYLFHCHNMQHEDSRMMSQFEMLPR